jgi:hypothetical protein
MRWRVLAVGAAVALGCTACGSVNAPPAQGKQVTGPILDLVTAMKISISGLPVGVRQAFSTQNDSATAVVELGQLGSASQLVMTWYRLTGTGSQRLFSKQITVSSYGFAYSTAVSAGSLPLGTYQVSASIAGVTKYIDWAVYVPATPALTDFHSHAGTKLKLGGSGSFPAAAPPARHCNHLRTIVSMPSISHVHVSVAAYCPPNRTSGPVRGVVTASMDKIAGLDLIGSMHQLPDGFIIGNFTINVCKLPGGSDVPGSEFIMSTLVLYGGYSRNFGNTFTLPVDHFNPSVRITSSVPAGTAVHPGEKITLRITGAEPTELGPQLGIRVLRLYGPSGQLYQSDHYKLAKTGCDNSRLTKTMVVHYTVPANAPKVLTLTAQAGEVLSRFSTATISFPVG